MATKRPPVPKEQWPTYVAPLPCILPCPYGCKTWVLHRVWQMDEKRFVPAQEYLSPLDGAIHICPIEGVS